MKRLATVAPFLAPVVALGLAGCASSGPVASEGQAERQCRAFVALEGLRVNQVGSAVAADGGYRVAVRIEDKLGRRLDNACLIAGTQTRWATPLPAAFERL